VIARRADRSAGSRREAKDRLHAHVEQVVDAARLQPAGGFIE
jgi:hypothetical protein